MTSASATAKDASTTTTPNRFLTDGSGTYDLASVSAIITNSSKTATLILDGSVDVKTQTQYETAVEEWQAYLNSQG